MLTKLFEGAVSPIINLSLQSKLLEPAKKKNRVNDMAYTKEGTDGQILRSSKWIVIVIMIFEKNGL